MLYIYGNWKMNNRFEDLKTFFKEVNNFESDENIKVGIAPSLAFLAKARDVANEAIDIAAQNMHFEDAGAYTGEVSALQLKDMGVNTVILGHSERRQYNGETNESINKKIKKAIEKEMTAIVCFGETETEYNDMKSRDVVKEQITEMIKGVNDIGNLIFAYEPVWAIGTGKSATAEYAEELCGYTREVIRELKGETPGRNAIILYGGSVKGENAFEILSQENINGALVGGASQASHDLKAILDQAKKATKF